MKREGSKSHLKSKIPTMKFVCPKMKWEDNKADKTKRRVCHCDNPVSYTHLDVYKRQGLYTSLIYAANFVSCTIDNNFSRFVPVNSGRFSNNSEDVYKRKIEYIVQKIFYCISRNRQAHPITKIYFFAITYINNQS